MPQRFIYIINPISGTFPRDKVKEIIRKETEKKNIPYFVFPSVASGDYSFLNSIIEEEKITDIIIAGGDGTVSQVVNSLIHHKVNFGILPCGSGNGLAFTAGISKNPSIAIEQLFNGKASRVDGFEINGQFACMLAGIGFDAQVAHDFAGQAKRGLTTYIKQVVKNFFSAKPFPFEIKLSDKIFRTDAYFISIANSNQFGNNFTIAPQASLSDGLLDIVIMTSQNKLSVLLETLKQVRGKNRLQTDTVENKDKAVIYFQTDRLSISNPNGAPLHIDGDPIESTEELNIKIRKKCFSLIQPR